jgi:uncharacterized protein (TIGR00296 family)
LIRIGTDGLIIRSAWTAGLLLPKVAVEYGFTVQEFLECTCRKAGLPRDAWRDLSNRIYTFQAEVFSEEEPQPAANPIRYMVTCMCGQATN